MTLPRPHTPVSAVPLGGGGLDPLAEFRAAVASVTSMHAALLALGKPPRSSAAYYWFQETVLLYDVDVSHFTRPPKVKPERVLRVYPASRKHRPTSSALRVGLLASGRAYACEGCGNPGSWRGRPMLLDVDHIDGAWRNCSAENLRFLCPNCHRQCDTSNGVGR